MSKEPSSSYYYSYTSISENSDSSKGNELENMVSDEDGDESEEIVEQKSDKCPSDGTSPISQIVEEKTSDINTVELPAVFDFNDVRYTRI